MRHADTSIGKTRRAARPVAAALGALVLAANLAVTVPARAEEDDPQELARQGVERLMKALNALIDNIPQYALPEVNENGDIIIRRLRPGEKKKPHPEDKAPGRSPNGDMDQT